MALSLTVVGCTEKKVYRIGVSQSSSDDWRHKMNDEIMHEAVFIDDIEVEIRSAENSNAKQLGDIRYFANNKFDLIAIAPNEENPLKAIIDSLFMSGTPVIVFDRNVQDHNYTTYIGADNLDMGRQAAKMAFKMLGGPGKVIEICGMPGHAPTYERRKGFEQEAKKLGIEILGEGNGNWTAETAYPVADSLLRLYPNTQLIYAHNDRMAIAAKEAARRLGLKHIKVIGLDAAPNIGLKALAAGELDATFQYPTDGKNLVHTAIDILQGKEVPKQNLLKTPAPVDTTNVQELLQEYNDMKEDLDKNLWLINKVESYWKQNSEAKALWVVEIVALSLLALLIVAL